MKNPFFLLFSLLLYSLCSAQTDSLPRIQVAQPLSVASFAVTPLDRNIQLTWAVTGNEDAKSFVVERSVAANVWAKIGGRLALGKTGTVDYVFVDALPKTNIVFTYRLVALGKDGSVLYSTPQSASLHEGFVCELKQNPVQSTLELETVATLVAPVKFTVLTAYGQKVSTETKKTTAGRNTVSLNAAGLAPGLYRLVVETGRQSQVISFVKE